MPPSTPKCGNITPDVLISPAGNVFTDVSEEHAVSLDGRSAFLMQGAFGDTIYHWVTSGPGEEPGAMRLGWRVNGEQHYCTVPLTNAPPAAQAQQGIRQVSSMAVPRIVHGEPVYFQVCIWYKVQKNPITRCWPQSG